MVGHGEYAKLRRNVGRPTVVLQNAERALAQSACWHVSMVTRNSRWLHSNSMHAVRFSVVLNAVRPLKSLVLAGCLGSCVGPKIQDAAIDCSAAVHPLFGADAGTKGSLEHVGVVAVFTPRDTLAQVCTVTRLESGWLLTAKHCFEHDEDFDLWVSFAPSVSLGQIQLSATGKCNFDIVSSRVARIESHPSLDLVLFRVDESDLRGVPLAQIGANVGEAVTMVGYGRQETGAFGAREQLIARVTDVTDSILEVRAGMGAGACLGDSGGPLLRRAARDFEVLGVLSRGSIDCVSYDKYVPVNAARPWITQVTLSF